jgi:adenine-specific DNA-methyltransferase
MATRRGPRQKRGSGDDRAPGGQAGRARPPRGSPDERIKNPYQRYHKLDRPALTPATTSLWQYPHGQYGKGNQGDPRFVGATPSWVIWQFLERWTKPGQRVVDPFCGGGTTLDVCRDLDREGVGFDLAPTREDIARADARALPLADKSVDHAFFDPPYADNLAYSDDPACIGRLKAEGGAWHDAMGEVIAELARVVRPGGFIAGYVQDTVRERPPREGGRGGKSFRFFGLGLALAQVGLRRLELVDHIAVVRGHQKLSDGREHAKAAQGALIRGFNHLLVFRVPTGQRPTRAGAPTGGTDRLRGDAPTAKRGPSAQQKPKSGPGPGSRAKGPGKKGPPRGQKKTGRRPPKGGGKGTGKKR